LYDIYGSYLVFYERSVGNVYSLYLDENMRPVLVQDVLTGEINDDGTAYITMFVLHGAYDGVTRVGAISFGPWLPIRVPVNLV